MSACLQAKSISQLMMKLQEGSKNKFSAAASDAAFAAHHGCFSMSASHAGLLSCFILLYILLVRCRWWPQRKRSPQQLLLSSVRALPYVALCASVLALGLIAGFILASPLAPQVLPSSHRVIYVPEVRVSCLAMQPSAALCRAVSFALYLPETW